MILAHYNFMSPLIPLLSGRFSRRSFSVGRVRKMYLFWHIGHSLWLGTERGNDKRRKDIIRRSSLYINTEFLMSCAKKNSLSRPACPKCGRKKPIKNGCVGKDQRWKCTACHFQFTRIAPRGRPMWQKSLVVFLYCYGMPLRSIARLFQIQPSTALKWIRHYTKEYQPAMEKGSAEIMGLDKLQKYLKKSGSEHSSILCLAISNAGFKKSMGINLKKH